MIYFCLYPHRESMLYSAQLTRNLSASIPYMHLPRSHIFAFLLSIHILQRLVARVRWLDVAAG